MAKKTYYFIPVLGMVSDTNIKEILQMISKFRLGYYRKYLIKFFKSNNEKSILSFKKNLQNKNVSQVENLIKKSLLQSKIDFIPKAPNEQKQKDPKKNLTAVKKYRSNKKSKKSFSILITDETKKALLDLKKQKDFRTMEDLVLYFIRNHSKNDFYL
jgi:hypothetical protein